MNVIGKKNPIIAYHTQEQITICSEREVKLVVVNLNITKGYLSAQDSFYKTHQQKQ